MSAPTPVQIVTGERPSWQLSRAVLVYTPQGNRNAGVYATLHDVETNGRDYRLQHGVPATREACADLARELGAASTLGGFVPPNLLYLGAKSIIWWRPPALATVFFDTTKQAAGDQFFDEKGAALIGKRSAKVAHPSLIFAVAGGRWYVYALQHDHRPHPTERLWRAPYFNVWASGQICTGNVRLPETLSTQALIAYEKAFFDSEFTHCNLRGKAKFTHHSDNPYAFWAGLLKRPVDLGFPTQILVRLNITLEGLAKRLEKDGRIGELD